MILKYASIHYITSMNFSAPPHPTTKLSSTGYTLSKEQPFILRFTAAPHIKNKEPQQSQASEFFDQNGEYEYADALPLYDWCGLS